MLFIYLHWYYRCDLHEHELIYSTHIKLYTCYMPKLEEIRQWVNLSFTIINWKHESLASHFFNHVYSRLIPIHKNLLPVEEEMHAIYNTEFTQPYVIIYPCTLCKYFCWPRKLSKNLSLIKYDVNCANTLTFSYKY